MKQLPLLFVLTIFLGCSHAVLAQSEAGSIKPSLQAYFDAGRNRNVPIAVYFPAQNARKKPLVILNHGYAPQSQDAYLDYSYLAEYFATQGYYVVSIQQDQPEDKPIPTEGNLQVLRRPFWETGVANIQFVLKKLKEDGLPADLKHLILVGHSNGGDIAALYATEHRKSVERLITLDNRRMPLPKTKDFKVLSLRSADQPADPGVLPTLDEQYEYGISIIRLKEVNHNDMDDDATEEQRGLITRYIGQFLNK